jgi:CrcB protein
MSSILPNKLPEHALQWKGFRRVANSSFPHDYRELAAVFAGGALGTVARTGLSLLVAADPGRWPWPTFTVNIVGAFLAGYFTTRLLERLPLSSYRRPLLGTGLCGGLTTFSTMQVETLKMIEHHHYALAAGYTCASSVFGFLAVYLATALVRRVPVR